jgi:hypothetical protein
MVLPAGITADDLSLLSAPDGWRLSATPDGYNVGGPPLEIGESAAYRVNVARLPANTTRLAFRTVQTYSDGRIEPDNRLAVLILAPAPRPAAPRPAPSPPPAQVSRPPAAVPPPVESSAPAEVPPVLPSLDPTFTLPAEPLPPHSEPAPSGSVAALATTGGRPGNALWISLAIAVAILAPTGLVVWRRRRTRPRRAHARPGSRVAGRRAGHRAEATAHRRGVPLA